MADVNGLGIILLLAALVLSVGGFGIRELMLSSYRTRLLETPTVTSSSRAIDPDHITRNTVPLADVVERTTARNADAAAMVAERRETGDIAGRHSDEGRVPRRV